MPANLFHTIFLSLFLLICFSGKPPEKHLPEKIFRKERGKLRSEKLVQQGLSGKSIDKQKRGVVLC